MVNTVNQKIGVTEAIDFLATGLKLALSKECRLFVIIPILINIVVLCLGGYLTVHWLLGMIDSLITDNVPAWLGSILVSIIGILLTVVVGFVACFFFSTIATIIASPFYGLLAEKAEFVLRGGVSFASDDSLMAVVKDIPRILGRELRKLGYYLPRLILCCIISLIPVLNIISPICWFLLAAWMMSIQYTDYAYDNHKISFQQMRQDLANHRWGAFSLGAVISLLMTLPLLNLILPPAAVCAGTKFFVEAQNRAGMGNAWASAGAGFGQGGFNQSSFGQNSFGNQGGQSLQQPTAGNIQNQNNMPPRP